MVTDPNCTEFAQNFSSEEMVYACNEVNKYPSS